jgi:uncharacterized protein
MIMSTEFQNIELRDPESYTIGVISDTHGLLRPEVITSFKGVDLILHAGDVGDPDILDELKLVAPALAVRGNMDYGSWAEALPVSRYLCMGKTKLLLIHDRDWIDDRVLLTDFQVIITGHTHRPLMEERNKVLFFNPGSAGYQRRQYPVSIGKLVLDNGHLDAQLTELGV